MKKLIKRLFLKQNPRVYEEKDAQLTPSLRTRDLIGLGTGMVVGTAIFTLPGIVAAEHTGPAVPLAFIVAAIGAGLSALAYAETSSVLPFAGSAFSWINVLFGEFFELSILFQSLLLRLGGRPICKDSLGVLGLNYRMP